MLIKQWVNACINCTCRGQEQCQLGRYPPGPCLQRPPYQSCWQWWWLTTQCWSSPGYHKCPRPAYPPAQPVSCQTNHSFPDRARGVSIKTCCQVSADILCLPWQDARYSKSCSKHSEQRDCTVQSTARDTDSISSIIAFEGNELGHIL